MPPARESSTESAMRDFALGMQIVLWCTVAFSILGMGAVCFGFWRQYRKRPKPTDLEARSGNKSDEEDDNKPPPAATRVTRKRPRTVTFELPSPDESSSSDSEPRAMRSSSGPSYMELGPARRPKAPKATAGDFVVHDAPQPVHEDNSESDAFRSDAPESEDGLSCAAFHRHFDVFELDPSLFEFLDDLASQSDAEEKRSTIGENLATTEYAPESSKTATARRPPVYLDGAADASSSYDGGVPIDMSPVDPAFVPEDREGNIEQHDSMLPSRLQGVKGNVKFSNERRDSASEYKNVDEGIASKREISWVGGRRTFEDKKRIAELEQIGVL